MKRKQEFTALLLALMLVGTGMLAGCGSSADDTEETSDGGESSSTIDAGDSLIADLETETEETVVREDVIGEVSYVGSSYISVVVYTTDAEITDYAQLDVGTLTESESTESVTTDSDTEYYTVSAGTLAAAAREDIEKGDVIASTTSEYGVHQIIILESGTEGEKEDYDISGTLN